jgi:multiple sugar transport system ATP-binding protein
MNNGVIEQLGKPPEIYDTPVSMFVADFIGSPPMSFLSFHGGVESGKNTVQVNGIRIEVPRIAENLSEGALAIGVRPEHVIITDGSDFRGEVFGAEYLGTTQIVTVDTKFGQLKARIAADQVVKTGEVVGLRFLSDRISLFEAASGRAIMTELNETMLGAAHG